MATAALDPAGLDATPAARARQRERFPWGLLILVWLGFSAVMLVRFWHAIVTREFSDADDIMRLLEVRDLLGGQSWFDLGQYRLDPPLGLASHWSRLVDLPLVAVIAPLTPLIGQKAAETVAIALVPLVTLGATMAALLAIVRRSVGREPLFVLIAPAIMVTSPAIFAQMFPTRIDHHGWQICLAAAALAALLDPRPRRSGALAGAAVALQISVSIEGLPYAVAAAGSLALLWLLDRERPERLLWFMVSLAVTSAAAFVATAPRLRWGTDLCDVVKPAHLATFAAAAAAIALAVRLTGGRNRSVRLAALVIAGGVSAAVFAVLAPTCVGSPFGQMDPLVHHYWYDNVLEGLPFTAQPLSGAVNVIVFPLVGLGGALVALARAGDAEARRRWMLIVLLGIATLLAGLAVRRAAGAAHILAVPGALMLFDIARRRIERIDTPLRRVPLTVAIVLLLSPAFPVGAAALIAPEQPIPSLTPAPPGDCGWRCDIVAIGRLPAATIFTEIDTAPRLIALTHHTAYAAGYHRLERPLHDTIAAFIGTDRAAGRLICQPRFGYLLVDPNSGETHIYSNAAPQGFLAHLVRGRTPAWLTRLRLPSNQLWLYRIDQSACPS